MKVYILYDAFSEEIVGVFKNSKDANNAWKIINCNSSVVVQEHEVIE